MEFTASELWSEVLETAKASMPEQSFRTWFSHSSAVGLSDGELIVEAPSTFHAEWAEDKYGPLLRSILAELLGRPLTLTFQCSNTPSEREVPWVEVTPPASPSPPAPQPSASPQRRPPPGRAAAEEATHLNDRYTFDRFVVGANNQLAAAAGHAVSERPARIYNPLFLYGGVGLGKTHLMHAIGHSVLAGAPDTQVAYVTCEYFMNELVNAIQKGTTRDFRTRFRKIDLLLVDDVHFLAQKESTQEEFFHTFNALYDAGKQIVLTSDRAPKELPGVEDRLVSRFEWGLVVDIKPPDYETRVAILQKKASDDDLVIDPEIIDFVARSCTASVRELEGAVIKLLAYSSLRNQDITLELARTALQSMIGPGSGNSTPPLTAERIRDAVARSWGVEPGALVSKRRTQDVTIPRQVGMFLIKELLDESLVRIGQHFGGRDHSTVIHSIRKVQKALEDDDEFAVRVTELRNRLTEGS